MKRVKLDRIDIKILRHLQENGRMTNVDLAKKAGISAPPCLRRVRALEEAGFIKSYHADLASDRLGYGTTIFVQVSLTSHAETDLGQFEKLVQSWPMVRECYMLAGEADYILKIVAENMETYQKFLTTHLTSAPNVNHVKSFMVIRRGKYDPGVPITESMLTSARGR
ncbi:MAG: winged helix-turn-helix transcriptional regulator [Alphaproteobacteria bacterium]|nr:winged helix-turn-helix transcriptional regulator [Alphaproteobacteria bacterium]